MTEQERSSLDEDAGPGSQGEVDPGSEGDFGGEPMDKEPDAADESGSDQEPRSEA